MEFDYDLFVIGGGSGGVRAARLASSEAGAKVGLAEEYRMGGTCVIRGCVPKKLMVYASHFPEEIKLAKAYGWDVEAKGFDWSQFRHHLHAELDRLEQIYTRNLEKAGVEIHAQRAVVKDPHTVALADGTEFTCRHILIATGGTPSFPPLEGAEEFGISSNDVFLFDELPESILIIGGGFIACEMACILNGLGVKTTIFLRGAQILRGFDDEARGHLADHMRSLGIEIHTGTSITDMQKLENGVSVRTTTGHEGIYNKILFATGRDPNTKGLGLEEAGVELGRSGEIVVNEYSQTGVPSIYAIGDVTGRIELTPVAIREGVAFVNTVFHGTPTPVDHELVPSAVYTQPELGTVGMTENEAERAMEAGGEAFEVYSTAFRPMKTAFAHTEDRVLMKLIVGKDTRKVLGCHIVAPEAGEMIQLAGIAIKMGATKEDFDRTCAVHPTMAEELVTMKSPTR
ncbi:glutathione-disulfide reductase [Oceanicola sp. 502str15]|uniref:glutathione-disulfide reductase n=1 Tax=Oceanicola sp. 502str15 TaxID=2696061 RepID=UPI0020963EE1|nr:glutathione-disulfide reductase [Oceanicola sp. 502str15]MCO6382949.1 glutathione-disulfide reductase [Oceanicola sp. 502str15]